ncbi:MAG: hypothetical protein H7Y61_18715, partial [Rhizobiales bacterium]|nr:hypothetical protein [Rhizobacter sp.]
MPAPLFLPRLFALLTLSVACQFAAGVDELAAPTPKKPKPLAIDAARDPLDVLRERLAQKLGAARAPDIENPNVVRVVSKPA